MQNAGFKSVRSILATPLHPERLKTKTISKGHVPKVGSLSVGPETPHIS